jgi:hypothetical protein
VTDLNVNPPALNIKGPPGETHPVTFNFPDGYGLTSLVVYVGGLVLNATDYTDAVEHVGVVTGESAVVDLIIPVSSAQPIRVKINDGANIGITGFVLPDLEGTDESATETTIVVGDVSVDVSILGGSVSDDDVTIVRTNDSGDIILQEPTYTVVGDETFPTGGAIRNARLFEVIWDYDQEEMPAEDSLMGTAFHADWTTDVNISNNGANTQTGWFGPRGIFNLEGTLRYAKHHNLYQFSPVGFGDFLVLTNTPEADRTLIPAWSFLSARFYGAVGGRTVTQGDNDTTSGSGNLVDSTVYYTADNSTWDGDTNEHAGFYTGVCIQGNVHLARRIGLRVNDIYGPLSPAGAAAILSDVLDQDVDETSAVIDENVGVEIVRLAGGTTNIGVRNASATVETPAAVTITSASQTMPIDVTEIQFTTATSYLMTTPIPAGKLGQRIRLTNVGTKPVTWPLFDNSVVKVAAGESRALTYTTGAWRIVGERQLILQNLNATGNVDDGADIVNCAHASVPITATVPRFQAWDYRPIKIRQTDAMPVTIVAGTNVIFQIPVGKTAMTSGTNAEVVLTPTGTFAGFLIYSLSGALATSVGSGLATTGAVNLNLATLNGSLQTITLTGDPTFTTSNRTAGSTLTLKIKAGASPRTITWPAWIPVGGALQTSLAAGKTMIVTVTFYDSTDAEATATCAVQP